MPPQKTTLNNSLLLRGNIWHIHWNVPKGLRSNPLFRGKAIYSKTLQTKDVYEARKMRDMLVTQFRQMAEVSASHTARQAFMAHYAEAKKAREEYQQRQLYMSDEDANHALDGLEAGFCVYAAVDKGDHIRADAYLAAIHDKHDVAEKYAITLQDAAWDFIKAHEGDVAASTLSKIKTATTSLLKAIGSKDTKLKDVTTRQVTRWIKAIAKDYSDNTRAAYLASLHKMWHWHWEHEHVDGESPFRGVKMERQGDEASYIPFTVEEVGKIVELASPAMKELSRFGLITGCRLSELTELTPSNFMTVDGVHAVQIFDGKTEAAARTIPLPVSLWAPLKQCIERDMWKGSSETNGFKFGKLKEKALGRKDRLKVFHSFRHMAATAYEREHVEERITSVLLGHKNKRGESMSYGLYSAGLSPKQYLEAVEKMLAGEYMQSFLSLFKD